MSTPGESSVHLPYLPNDIISDIIAMTDLKTIGRCRSLSTYWRRQLQADDFLLMHLEYVKRRCGSIYLHVVSPCRGRGRRLFKINSWSGSWEEIYLPFEVSIDSQMEVVGSGNGIIAVRCGETDNN
ncbi:hypothetical protein PIB30_106554, partial [Stylosanthes scabra]|nr:hypothetical protein [Stylosanthes scabra]